MANKQKMNWAMIWKRTIIIDHSKHEAKYFIEITDHLNLKKYREIK